MKKFVVLILFLELVLVGAFLFAPGLTAAAPCPAGEVCVFNPLGVKGVNSPGELVMASFMGFTAIFGILAIAFVVFNGFKLIISSGNEESIKSAREGLTWSVGGFVVAVISFSLVAAAEKLLGFDISRVGLGTDTLGPVTVLNGGPTGDFLAVSSYLMMNFLGLIGFASTLMMIYYGYRYVTSAGNEESVEKAKAGIKWTLVGLIATRLAYTIINSVQQYLVHGPS